MMLARRNASRSISVPKEFEQSLGRARVAHIADEQMELCQNARHNAVAGWGDGVPALADTGDEVFCGSAV